jgi:hypothetical protein
LPQLAGIRRPAPRPVEVGEPSGRLYILPRNGKGLIMKYVVIALAAVGFIFGVAAAVLWWRASAAIPMDTIAVAYSGPGQSGADAASAVLSDLQHAGRLNQWAAGLTAVAVFFSTISTLVGALAP